LYTAHKRTYSWATEGVLESILATLAGHLRERGELDLSECFIDATIVAARSGEVASGRPSEGRERNSWR
jgi:hypothetical protein